MADETTAQNVTLPPGTALIRQGELSRDIFYWVAGGRVRIVVDGAPVREIAFDAQTKCFFGDLAALLGYRRTSSVETVTENTFLRIPFEPGKVDALLKTSPVIAQHWLSSLARTASDSIEALQGRQQTLETAQKQLRHCEQIEKSNEKKWSGALFVTEKLYAKMRNPAVGGILRYLQRLKFFDMEMGRSQDMEGRLVNQDLSRGLF